MQNLSKLHGVFRIEHRNPINVTEQKKKDAISNYHNLKITHRWYVCILKMFFAINIVCIF
jgi:hypothetical protein